MDIRQTASLSPEMMVCQTLKAATGNNIEVVFEAQAQLVEWEVQPGFFPTLTRICLPLVAGAEQQFDENVRWMASVYLKSGIKKYWRRGAHHELPQEEKQVIRDLLLLHFANETNPQISLQSAAVMARIARIDFPCHWPQLMPELMKRLQAFAINNDIENYQSVKEQRILHITHHVIKALASCRSGAQRNEFIVLTSNIYNFIYWLWDTHCALFFHQLREAPALAKPTLEKVVLFTRILRKLTICGYSKPESSSECLLYIEKLFERIKNCLHYRFQLRQLPNADEHLMALLDQLILRQMETLLEFRDSYALAFKNYACVALQFAFDHLFHVSAYLICTDNAIDFQQFAIHCINLMAGLMSPFYWQKIEKFSNADEKDKELEIRLPLENFFTVERLSYMCKEIITHYFVLTQAEVTHLCLEDPEEVARYESGGDKCKYALRPCMESLFAACFTAYKSKMSAGVVKYIHEAQQIQLSANSDLKDILLKDAIYNAAGQAALHIFNELDFDAWFSGQLLNELKIESPNFRILRRRIIWLLGEWAGVKLSRDLRPLAYEACLYLLRPCEDMSLRLASSRSLSMLLSNFDFDPVTFLPYLEQSFNDLFILFRVAKDCDTKRRLLTIMTSLVAKMSDNIEPFADSLNLYLPLMWKESELCSYLQCAVICTLQQVVRAMRDIPEKMPPILYSVIGLSTEIREPSQINLIEEGLILWVAVVENSTCMTEPLIDLCRNIMPIIENSPENLRTVLFLMQAFILLDARAFLDRYGSCFVNFCNRMFDNLRPGSILLMVKVLEICLKTDPTYGLELIRPVLPYIFKQVYANKDLPMLMGMYLTIIARVLLISHQVFMMAIQEIQEPDALQTILDVWITKMTLVTEPENLKLFALAFLSIFSNKTILLERFPAIMQNISVALFEIMREVEDDQQQEQENTNVAAGEQTPIKYYDSLVFVDECDLDISSYCTMDDFDCRTHHYARWRQLLLKDPLHKIALPHYIEWQLANLRTQLGDDAYQQLMRTVYPAVLKRFAKFLNLQINFQVN